VKNSQGAPVHSHSEEYRSKAAACLLAAETTTFPDVRARWLAMAQAWNRLAEEADRREIRDLLGRQFGSSERGLSLDTNV
jgi:hypothetical protein